MSSECRCVVMHDDAGSSRNSIVVGSSKVFGTRLLYPWFLGHERTGCRSLEAQSGT